MLDEHKEGGREGMDTVCEMAGGVYAKSFHSGVILVCMHDRRAPLM